MKGSIKIQKERCKGCGYCVDACPAKALAISSRFNAIGYFPAMVSHRDRCTGCGVCATVCPDIAITVYRSRREKKT